jgi:hypothetical protein
MFILKQRREGDFHHENYSYFILSPGAKIRVISIFVSVFDLKNGRFPIQISRETARFWVDATRVPYPA